MYKLTPSPVQSMSYNEIIPNLFIGDYKSIQHATQFKMIVNCTRNIPFPIPLGICKIRVPIDDSPSETAVLLKVAPAVIDKIHNALQNGDTVLVHCHAGMQRSCTIVAMYLMKYRTINQKPITPENAIQYIQLKRPIAFQPQPTFTDALKRFYEDIPLV